MKRSVRVRLLHDGKQPGKPLDEPLTFGFQDVKGEVHAGTVDAAAGQRFDFTLGIKDGEIERPIFTGPFVHEPPAKRFLYLSWKRRGEHAAPWGWRIKIALDAITWAMAEDAEKPGMYLVANVTDRRPHRTEPVDWQVRPA